MVALSEFWEKFVNEYAADAIYWYFPKGGTADTEEFREKFRIFQSFEGKDWTPDCNANSWPRSTRDCRRNDRADTDHEAGL